MRTRSRETNEVRIEDFIATQDQDDLFARVDAYLLRHESQKHDVASQLIRDVMAHYNDLCVKLDAFLANEIEVVEVQRDRSN